MRFRPKRSDLIFIGLVIGVIVFVTSLPTPRESNPPVPVDLIHRGIKLERNCLACHTQSGARPLTTRHPKRQDCFRCHRVDKPTA
jgi:hypothetical protein